MSTTLCCENKQNAFISEWDYSKEKSNPKQLCKDVLRILGSEHNKEIDEKNTLVLEQLYMDNCFIKEF